MLFGSNMGPVLEQSDLTGSEPISAALEALSALIEEYEVDVVELPIEDLIAEDQAYALRLFEALAHAQQRYGIAFTAHLPFRWIDLSSGNELVRQASVETIVQAVEMTGPADIMSYVLHATGIIGEKPGPVIGHPEEDRRTQIAITSAGRSLRDLRERLPDQPIAVENLPGIPYEWQSMFVERYGMAVCCDIGHLILQYRDPIPFLERWSSRLQHLHIHGVSEAQFSAGTRVREDHRALGCPNDLVDTGVILTRLGELEFDGPVIIENDTAADLTISLATLRRASAVGETPEIAYSAMRN